jgi:hypothetical protein
VVEVQGLVEKLSYAGSHQSLLKEIELIYGGEKAIMATLLQSQAMLPSVKCSSCGIEIEIDHMADHKCQPR